MSDVSQGSLPDTDDGTADYLDLDSDGDGCKDVINRFCWWNGMVI